MKVLTEFVKTLVDSAGSTRFVIFVLLAEALLIAVGHPDLAKDYAPSLVLGIFAWLVKHERI